MRQIAFYIHLFTAFSGLLLMYETSVEALERNKFMKVSCVILMVLHFEIAVYANVIVVLDYIISRIQSEQLLADCYLYTSLLLTFLILPILNTFRQSMWIYTWSSGVSTQKELKI